MSDSPQAPSRAPLPENVKPPLGLTLAVGAGYAVGKLLAVAAVVWLAAYFAGIDLTTGQFAGAVLLTTYISS